MPLLEGINMYAGLTINGRVNQAVRVEYADALAQPTTWLPLSNFNLPYSPYIFIDYTSPSASKRFYRVFSP